MANPDVFTGTQNLRDYIASQSSRSIIIARLNLTHHLLSP